MARLFDISTTTDTLTPDAQGRATLSFSVTNKTDKPQRGTLALHALDGPHRAWFTLDGADERSFAPGMTDSVSYQLKVPAGTPAGRLRVRLDCLSVIAPEEDFTEGPVVSITVPEPDKGVTGGDGKRPWWLWLLVGLLVLAVVGGGVWLKSRSTGKPDKPGPASSAPTGDAPPPPPRVESVELNDPRIAVNGRNLPLDLCRHWGRDCKGEAATAYCRSKGYGDAMDFRIVMDSPPTYVIGDAKTCGFPECDRISWVRCAAKPAFPVRLIINAETMQLLQRPAKALPVPVTP